MNPGPPAHLVVPDHAHFLARVQHLLVPLHQSLRLGDLLLQRVAVEDVVVTLAGGTRPNVCRQKPTKGRVPHEYVQWYTHKSLAGYHNTSASI